MVSWQHWIDHNTTSARTSVIGWQHLLRRCLGRKPLPRQTKNTRTARNFQWFENAFQLARTTHDTWTLPFPSLPAPFPIAPLLPSLPSSMHRSAASPCFREELVPCGASAPQNGRMCQIGSWIFYPPSVGCVCRWSPSASCFFNLWERDPSTAKVIRDLCG